MWVILLQGLLLSLISLGWAYWLNQAAPVNRWRFSTGVVQFGAAFAAQIILLQNLVYLDVPITLGYYVPAIVGIVGVVRIIWNGGWRRIERWPKDAKYGLALSIAIFVIQSGPALLTPLGDYYANAHIDHLNYTSTAEFLRTEKFSTPADQMMSQPWMLPTTQHKNFRIGQSVAMAYAASLTMVSAKDAYAALCAFLVALLALAVFALGRLLSLRRVPAIAAAFWVGVAPATTHIQLDGFLSQVSVLFCFPMLLLWARQQAAGGRFQKVTGAILCSYLLICYTEYFVIAVALLGLLSLADGMSCFRERLLTLAPVLLGGIVLVPGYIMRAFAFAKGQYAIASSRVDVLEALAPNGGTLFGWASTLVGLPLPAEYARNATIAIGVIILILGACGLYSRSLRTRVRLWVIVGTPGLFLLLLALRTELARYPFQKICDSFAFVGAVLAFRGIWVATNRVGGSPIVKKMLPAFAAFLLPMIGLTGTVSQQMRLLQDPGPLSIVHDQGYRDALRYVAANPSRTYVIRASGLAAGWYAYEGRKSRVFIAGSSVADIPIPPGSLPIARIPAQLDNGTFLFADRYLDETVANAKPVVEVHNPQGEDGLGKAKWYWLGDSMRVTVFTMSGPDQAVGILSLTGEAGPANPAPERVLRLTDVTTGTPHELKLQGQARLSVPVLLRRGVNNFVIETVSPKEVVTPIPGDPRKHLVRISQIEVERRDKQAPQGSAATPVIFPDNPQGEDRGPNGSSWYWVGKFMDLKIVWPEGQQGDARYELRFSAEAGPANPDRRRTIRILDLDAKTEEKVELSEPKKVAVGVKRRLGTTNLRVEVAFPAEQIAKIPSDPRNHMLRASEFEIVAIEPTKRRQ